MNLLTEEFINLDEELINEISLWRAVIFQAISDAKTKSNNKRALLHKLRAKKWLTEKDKDFQTIVAFAHLDYDYICKKIDQVLARTTPFKMRVASRKKRNFSKYFK